jgi:hypothetical protein
MHLMVLAQVYLHILKQLTENEWPESFDRGCRLLAQMLRRSLPPSTSLSLSLRPCFQPHPPCRPVGTVHIFDAVCALTDCACGWRLRQLYALC